MSKIAGLPKSLPSKEIPFSVKIKGSFSKHTYTGDFTVKVPSVAEISRIGVELARLNDGVPLEALDISTGNLNNCIAFLKVTLKDAPEWFTDGVEGLDYGLNTLDVNVAPEVFKKANDLIEGWQKKVRGSSSSTEEKSDEAS